MGVKTRVGSKNGVSSLLPSMAEIEGDNSFDTCDNLET